MLRKACAGLFKVLYRVPLRYFSNYSSRCSCSEGFTQSDLWGTESGLKDTLSIIGLAFSDPDFRHLVLRYFTVRGKVLVDWIPKRMPLESPKMY